MAPSSIPSGLQYHSVPFFSLILATLNMCVCKELMITALLAATLGIIAAWQMLLSLQCIQNKCTLIHRYTERQIFMRQNTPKPLHSSLGKSWSWGVLFWSDAVSGEQQRGIQSTQTLLSRQCKMLMGRYCLVEDYCSEVV